MNRAVFLDRDGTLIRDKGFICHFKDVEIFPFSLQSLKMMNEYGFRIIVITNQSAIARGICTENQVMNIHREMTGFFKRSGAVIDAFYYSPYLEDAPVPKFRKRDESRKPAPGMILKAAEDFGVNLSESFVIGDSSRDILAGKKAGCKTILVLTGNGPLARMELENLKVKPDLVSENLLDAAEKITRDHVFVP
jgi:D-glycero-D-manno-heptose 1,7-bisphosphate phosphatase